MVADICDYADLDWNIVREGWLLDPRVNPMHTAVFQNERGFKGKCLPKDTRALETFGKLIGADTRILTSVLDYNEYIKEENDGQE